MVALSSFPKGTSAYTLANSALKKFQTWREKTVRGNRLIPEELQLIAAKLARVSSVNKVSRFLSLDYCKLKARTKALDLCFPPSHQRNSDEPQNLKGQLSQQVVSTHSSCKKTDDLINFVDQGQNRPQSSENSSDSLGLIQESIDQSGSPHGREGHLRPVNGLIEVLGLTGPPVKKYDKVPMVLAQIQSPGGYVLQLFSEKTNSIVEAFLRS